MVKAVIFDLGNTLIEYYSREDFHGILEEAIDNCFELLGEELKIAEETIWCRVKEHNHGSPGDKVYPMEERLSNIFQVNDEKQLHKLCEVFMKPVFKTSKIYDDTIPVLRELKRRGYKVGVLTNTPWGCPSNIWLAELERYELTDYVDEAVCGYDVGWRKPDPRPFKHRLQKLNVNPEESLFVGDNPRWDIDGPRALGMKTLLIDRTGLDPDAVHGLAEVLDVLAEEVFRE